jgi:hypothetical protein
MAIVYSFDIRACQPANRIDWFAAPEGVTMEQAVLQGSYIGSLDDIDFRLLASLWDYCDKHRIPISYNRDVIWNEREIAHVWQFFVDFHKEFEPLLQDGVLMVHRRRWINETPYRMATIVWMALYQGYSLFTVCD